MMTGKKRAIALLLALVISISLLPMAAGAASGGWQNSGGKWWYRYENGGYPVNAWQQIGGVWYHFGADGYMQTGWQQIGIAWYYFDASGCMVTGWQQIGGAWYWFDAAGAMRTGWLQQRSFWYYLKPSGAMATGWQQIGGTWYYFDAAGVMQTDWLRQGSAWYYLSPSGAMATGWERIGGTWYYFNAAGVMQTGWLQQGSTWYYLKPSGAMAAGETIGSYSFDADGRWIQKSSSGGSGQVKPGSELSKSNILALLDIWDTDGAWIIRKSGCDESKLLSWFRDGTATIGEGCDSISTAVHEECHEFTSQNGGIRYNAVEGRYTSNSENIYIGNGRYIVVEYTDVFFSKEIVGSVPGSLRTSRFNLYVDGDEVMASIQEGVYGLLNEFTAYCWGLNNSVRLYDYEKENDLLTGWYTDEYVSYAEFRYYILSYMLYAREHYPEVYQAILDNDSFRRAFSAVDDIFAGLVDAWRSDSSRLISNFEDEYIALAAELAKPEYVQMAALLRP